MIKMGSKWSGGEGKIFRVIYTAEIDGKTWIHYRLEDQSPEPREFSCLEESFLFRFRPIVNE